uniref:Si:dkey-65j6.2 n=1 Tax=Oncorhynchus mykiss TaxID=8022 RepID=A0A8C7TFK7_ONCMY
MNPESLDGSIQNTLSALFPPFEATAPTVLSQLFQVIEERFRGDALQCLLDFLIPAKHILESVQQAACAQYSDVVFCCEGWPLCLHEKVVIQLAPINPLFLCPGDFYLQVAPFSEQAARIVVRSLLEDGQGQVVEVEETPIPETSYPCIFSEDWLGELNQGRHGTPLSHCVLSTDQGMVKVPWAQVTLPEFVDKPRTMASSSLSPAAVQQEVVAGPGPSLVLPHPAPVYSVETRISPAKHGIAVSLRLVDSNCSRLVKVDQDGPMAKPIGWVSPNTWDSRSNNTSEVEGEYVDLVEFTNKKEALLLSGAHSYKYPRELMRMGQVSKAQELRCRYRESYHSALQNPVTFERDNTLNTLAVLEEASPCEGRLGLEGKELCPGVSQQCCHPDPGHHDQIPPVTLPAGHRRLVRNGWNAILPLAEQIPHAVHSVLILVEKESSHRPEKCPGQQIDVVTSLKALHKLVEGSQLTYGLEGTLPYSHQDWLQLHQKLHPFMSDLQEASGLLLKAIRKLEGGRKIDKDVQRCILEQRTLMKDVLEDSRLVALQREGGAMLARLRRESDLRYSHCEDYSDAVDSVTYMYNHVEEQAHMLVQRSNMSLEHLEYLLQLREMEGHFSKVHSESPHIQEWFDAEGERRLLEAESVEDSREKVAHTLQSFRAFLSEANEQKHQAMVLVTEAEKIQGPSPYPETEVFRTMVCTFKSGLADSLSRAERCSSELETMVSVCSFCEQATELAKDCREYLGQEQVGRHPETDDISTLQMYQESFVQFSPDRFQEVKAQACALRGSRGMRVWNVAWLKCQEVRQQLEERLQDVERALWNTGSWYEQHRHGEDQATAQTVTHHDRALLLPRPGPPHWYNPPTGSMVERYHGILESRNNSVTCCNINFKPQNNRPCKGSKATTVLASPRIKSIRRVEREPSRREACRGRRREAATLADSQTVGCEWFPWKRGGLGRSMSEDSCATAMSSQSEARVQTPSCSHGQPSCRILQAAQKFQISRHGSFCSAESCSGQEGAEKASSRNTSSSVRRCEGTTSLASPEENAGSVMKLQRIMEELLLTEREYVRSLGYILMHYLPLLERTDVPQDLRGKRGVIFGNLEKLYDFHGHFFLRELEACQTEPLGVARCFLRHRESLGLYALYSKNKPQSDALILHHRHDIFKRKQQELGDQMDLSSYLLRPIQRISKYSLLLQDMLGVCGPQRDRDREELQAAADVIRFQMRHGNDLLTMDAIQDCDVNLKEQGQLIRQDEFIVFFRKKKCFRHIFLFQDLILFSKTKKTDVGNDVYIYKHSFKTSDIGMTHNSGESGLCFEIWIRRRKSQDTYTLKADRAEVKRSWTRDLEQILWEQAAYSRDLRMQERVFNGMGRKPFMDIQPSEAAICDRAVNCVLLGRDIEYLRPNSIGSGSSASTSCSHSSSSSGRGSLPPVGYPGNQTQGGEASHIVHSFPATVTEEDLSNHHNHQKQNLHLSEFSCSWMVHDDYRLKLTDIQYFTLDTVACESIHPPWNFPYFVAL